MMVLVDLLKAMEKGRKRFLGALLESIRKPYKPTMGAIGGYFAKLKLLYLPNLP